MFGRPKTCLDAKNVCQTSKKVVGRTKHVLDVQRRFGCPKLCLEPLKLVFGRPREYSLFAWNCNSGSDRSSSSSSNFSFKFQYAHLYKNFGRKACRKRMGQFEKSQKDEENAKNSQHPSARTSTTTKHRRSLLFLGGWYAKKRVSTERGTSNWRAGAQQCPNRSPVRAGRGRMKERVFLCLNVIYCASKRQNA